MTNRKSNTRAFQRAIDEVHKLPLSLPKGGSKSELFLFTARRSYASAILGVVIQSVSLSVCLFVRPSVTRVLCD